MESTRSHTAIPPVNSLPRPKPSLPCDGQSSTGRRGVSSRSTPEGIGTDPERSSRNSSFLLTNIQKHELNIKYIEMARAKDLSGWPDLTQLTQGQPIVVERVRLAGKPIVIEGQFELPQLARLNLEDQVFITAFVRCHGSIKEMEQIFGISYPTVKSRLNRIAESLEFVDTDPTPSQAEILDRLKRGEISAQEAIRELEAFE